MSKHPRKTKPARQATPNARQAACLMLGAIREGANLDEAASLVEDLPPPERARARRLAIATLRYRGRSDAVLTPLFHRRPRPAVMDALQLATTEMLGLGEAAYGVVNETVNALRAGPPKVSAAAGMANAVLRRAAEAQEIWDVAAPAPLPAWLRKPVGRQWGEATVRAIEAAHEAGAPLDLTLKSADAVAPEAEALPTGSLRLAAIGQVSALAGYDEGGWWVQDAAAALPARLLAPLAGETVADLCAAPGGKTLQLAAAGAKVTAIDISASRMQRLRENLARCGLAADLVTGDALEWRPEALLDAVLLDAPCSATGTIRRHPELPLIRDGAAIDGLVALQAQLIDHALTLLRPGGRLVYAVCSILPAEGEEQLRETLLRHPDLTVVKPDAQTLGIEADWITPEGALRTRPDYWPQSNGLDGFFIAMLVKPE